MPYQRPSMTSNGYSSDIQKGEEGPTYLIEHLATFTVSKETGILYPADGMRKLLQLEKSNGIWSQKMNLRLDKNWVLIMDYENGAVVERFPVSAIQEPTAFTSSDPIEIYNNILVFVIDDRQHAEMHIFQCQMISAQDLVEDLKLLRLGKAPMQRGNRLIPPPPPTPPPEPPLNGSIREFASRSHGDGKMDHPDDETSSTSSEKYGRDVTTLNHCFDDIEKFIARLQHVAAASRELERRRKNRKTKKKDAMGDGMLTMRAKPPPETEFIDIFQKFKLSFILLARLKHHIHDPNAPELVHFLFTPLALIVDASHDTNYGNLPAKVVSPLLTQEAVNLLINCVTSKETELWHSLGDAWLIPRDQWKGYVPPYHPVFMDGWSPDYPVIHDREDRERRDILKASHAEDIHSPHEGMMSSRDGHLGREREDAHYNSDYFDFDREDGSSPTDRYGYDRGYTPRNQRYHRDDRPLHRPEGDSPEPGTAAPRSDISADSIERNGAATGGEKFERTQAKWLEQLKGAGAKIVQVTYPRTANNDKELSVTRGEYLQVIDDSRKWWKARNSRGEVAHVPHTIVTLYQPNEGSDLFNSHMYPNRSYYHPQGPQDEVESEISDVPPTPSSVRYYPEPDWVEAEIVPKAPKVRQYETLQHELKSALINREINTIPKVAIKRTPKVFINNQSSAEEVATWLKEKGFSDETCNLLSDKTGAEIFELSKDEIQIYGGPEEGRRLYSQLLLQKKNSGIGTIKGNNELLQKLSRVREKIETKQESQEDDKPTDISI